VKAGLWFGAKLMQSGSYSFVGCTVSPGFEFAGFELAKKATLMKTWPDAKDIIARLT
jgi:predicted cupin superfamily sugar epimerase